MYITTFNYTSSRRHVTTTCLRQHVCDKHGFYDKHDFTINMFSRQLHRALNSCVRGTLQKSSTYCREHGCRETCCRDHIVPYMQMCIDSK